MNARQLLLIIVLSTFHMYTGAQENEVVITSAHGKVYNKADGINFELLDIIDGTAFLLSENIREDFYYLRTINAATLNEINVSTIPMRIKTGELYPESIVYFNDHYYLLMSLKKLSRRHVDIFLIRFYDGFGLSEDTIHIATIPQKLFNSFYMQPGIIDKVVSNDENLLGIYYRIGRFNPVINFTFLDKSMEIKRSDNYDLSLSGTKIDPRQFLLYNDTVIRGFAYADYEKLYKKHTLQFFTMTKGKYEQQALHGLQRSGRPAVRHTHANEFADSEVYIIADNGAKGTVLPATIEVRNPVSLKLISKTVLPNELYYDLLKEPAGETKKGKKKEEAEEEPITDSILLKQTIINSLESKKLYLNPIRIFTDQRGNFLLITELSGTIYYPVKNNEREEVGYHGNILLLKTTSSGEIMDYRIIRRMYLAYDYDLADEIFVRNDLLYFLLSDNVLDNLFIEAKTLYLQNIDFFDIQLAPGTTIIEQNNIFGNKSSRTKYYDMGNDYYIQFHGRTDIFGNNVKGYLRRTRIKWP